MLSYWRLPTSESFIASLADKLTALSDATLAAEHIGHVRFQVCPACYSRLGDENKSIKHACHLCKTPFDSDHARARLAALMNDTAVQLKQSQQLQVAREQREKGLVSKVGELEQKWRAASTRLDDLKRLPSSEAREALRALSRRQGYLDRERENLEQHARVIELINQLSEKKSALNDAITRLKAENEVLRASQKKRLSLAYTAISDEIRNLLRHDLRRQNSVR